MMSCDFLGPGIGYDLILMRDLTSLSLQSLGLLPRDMVTLYVISRWLSLMYIVEKQWSIHQCPEQLKLLVVT